MTERKGITVSTTTAPGTDRLYFGPSKMGLPVAFEGTVLYTEHPLRVTIRARFDGSRVEAKVVGIERTDGAGVTPRDLTRVELGAAISAVTQGALRPDDGAHVACRPGRRPTDEELRLVTDVYWYHHVVGGSPRQAVMTLWDLPKSTADGWLRRARELYDFPES